MSRKTDPRFILNVNIKDEELEEKIKVAVDEYINSVMESMDLDQRIHDAIDAKIQREVEKYVTVASKENDWRYSYENERLKTAVRKAVDSIIDQRVKEKLVEGFMDKLNVRITEDNS